MTPFMGVSGFGGPGSALGKYTPDPRLSDSYWIASLEKQGGTTANEGSEGNAIAVDNRDGSVYVVGSQIRAYNSSGSVRRTMYLIKFDKAGTLQWQRLIGHRTENDGTIGKAVGVDGQGNVYAIGIGWLTTGGGFGGTAYHGIMITKYNSSGEIIYQKKYDGYGYDHAMNGLKVTDGGTLYIPHKTTSSGYYSQYSYTQMGYSIFDSNGVYQARRYYIDNYSSAGSIEYDVAGVEIDSSNNVYLVGHTNGHANATSRYGGILVKYPPHGTNSDTPIWKYALYFQDAYGRQDVKLYSTTMDSSGNLYVAGTIVYSQGHAYSIPEEAFVCQVRYDVPETRHDDGTHATPTGFWCRRFKYASTTTLRSTFENGQISIDSDGNLIAVGSVTAISTGEKDYLIMKLDPSDGSEIWTRTLNNYQGTSGGYLNGVVEDSGQGLAIDNRNNIYVCGKYERSSDKGTMIAKLPGDGSLYDVQGGTYTNTKIMHGGRYRYSNNDAQGGWAYTYDDIGAVGVSSSNYYRMYQSNEVGQVNSNTTGAPYMEQGNTTAWTGIGSMGHTVSVIHDTTRPIESYSYDYSFPNEVYYGDGTIGSGSTIPLGTQNYHYSGDGTMPAVGLGTVQNWDMFFELNRGQLDQNSYTNGDDEDYVIGNNGFAETNGFMLHFKDTFLGGTSTYVYANMKASAGNTTTVSTLMPPMAMNPITTEETRPMRSEWSWFKLEWRGGTSFKIWHKKTSTGNYSNLYTNTGIGSIHSGTDWNYISIGQVRQNAGDSFTGAKQFFGKIKNFGLNVNSNVVDLSDNTNISTDELIVHIDASNPNSYSGIGSTCNNLARNIGITTDTYNLDGVVYENGFTDRNNGNAYRDIILKTGSGLDPSGVTTSLSNHTTLNGVPVFTNLRGYSVLDAYNESGTYVGGVQVYDMSYSIWYYADAADLSGGRSFITPWSTSNQIAGWNMGINYSGQLYVGTAYHGAETTSITLTANNWYNIVMVSSDQGTVDFYINGVKQHTGSTNWGYNYSYHVISIGGVGIDSSNYHQTNYYYNVSGPIASVAVYNKRLIQSEVESNYNRNCTKYGLPYLSSYNSQ